MLGLDTRAGHSETMGVLSAGAPDLHEAAVAALIDHLRATEVGFVAVPDTGGEVGWPWLAATSARWYAYAFTDHGVRAYFHGGPWFTPDLGLPDYGIQARDRPRCRTAHGR